MFKVLNELLGLNV